MSRKPAERPDGGVVTQRTANPPSRSRNPRLSDAKAVLGSASFRQISKPVRKKSDRDEAICDLYLSGLTMEMVAARFGITRPRVWKILRRWDVAARPRRSALRDELPTGRRQTGPNLPRTMISQKRYWYFRHPGVGTIKLRGAAFSAEWLEHYFFLMAEAGEEVNLVRVQLAYEGWLADRRPDYTVYFAGWFGGPVKIGVARDVRLRLSDLQSACPYKLEEWATTPGGYDLEGRYHRLFAAHRIQGEWFARCPEIEAEITRLTEATHAPQ